MSNFKKKTLATVPATAQPIEPVREAHMDLTDEEFVEFHAMYVEELAHWQEAQKPINMGGDEDATHGPGVTCWVNPDSVTGPGVKH